MSQKNTMGSVGKQELSHQNAKEEAVWYKVPGHFRKGWIMG